MARGPQSVHTVALWFCPGYFQVFTLDSMPKYLYYIFLLKKFQLPAFLKIRNSGNVGPNFHMWTVRGIRYNSQMEVVAPVPFRWDMCSCPKYVSSYMLSWPCLQVSGVSCSPLQGQPLDTSDTAHRSSLGIPVHPSFHHPSAHPDLLPSWNSLLPMWPHPTGMTPCSNLDLLQVPCALQ